MWKCEYIANNSNSKMNKVRMILIIRYDLSADFQKMFRTLAIFL